MGPRNTKSSLRNAIIHLNISADFVGIHDDKFWSQIWQEDVTLAADVVRCISTQEIRILRDGSPRNFATLTYKMVERLCLATGTLCNTSSQQTAVLNATRILTRVIPCIFEDKRWRNFFELNSIPEGSELRQEPKLVYPEKRDDEKNYESYLPTKPQRKPNEIGPRGQGEATLGCISRESSQVDLLSDHNFENPPQDREVVQEKSLMKLLILSICDLLFCPEFTVLPHTDNNLSSAIDAPPEDLKSLATCDYVWEPGVGFDTNINSTTYYDKSRAELLRLLLVCFSVSLYDTPDNSILRINQWIALFASQENRHALPLFTSLINTVFNYKPPKLLPLNRILFEDTREELVELSIQLLIATLDYKVEDSEGEAFDKLQASSHENLFIEYLSRIHRDEDFNFIVKGFKRLLNNCLDTSYLLGSVRQINFDQELLILFWKLCNFNPKFMGFLLKSDDILAIIVPTLYHLSENFQDSSKTALIHIGVFNLLLLSGDRNFGVKLNLPYETNIIPNLPHFSGSHADLLIIVFHKLILYGLNINQLYDFLLTILVNISPYLKSLSMLACKCLIQLFDVFSSPYIIFTEPNYHQLTVFLLEIFNNLIQYQFDGNATLVCVILSKRNSFIDLANLPTTQESISKVLNKLLKKRERQLAQEGQVQGEKDSSQTSNCGSSERSESNGQSKQQPQSRPSTSPSYFQQLGAIVSSSNQPSKPKNQPEVSLVATPDICNVTQAIHPFDHLESLFSFPATNNQTSESPLLKNSEDIIDLEAKDDRIFSLDTNEETEKSSGDDKQPTDLIIRQMEDFGLSMNEPEMQPSENAVKRWKPTPDWTKQYKQSLPLQSILRMIQVLVPQVERLKTNDTNSSQVDESATIRFLQSSTLVGLLPVPHPILIRKYRTNSQTAIWFRACTWGMIFVRNPLWIDTDVRLIRVSE